MATTYIAPPRDYLIDVKFRRGHTIYIREEFDAELECEAINAWSGRKRDGDVFSFVWVDENIIEMDGRSYIQVAFKGSTRKNIGAGLRAMYLDELSGDNALAHYGVPVFHYDGFGTDRVTGYDDTALLVLSNQTMEMDDGSRVAEILEVIEYDGYAEARGIALPDDTEGVDTEEHVYLEGLPVEQRSLVRKRMREVRDACLTLHRRANGGFVECIKCGYQTPDGYRGEVLEIHHRVPLSKLTEPTPTDPWLDVDPLCPTCHRLEHMPTTQETQ